MKWSAVEPPCDVDAGALGRLRACARVELEPDDQVTFVTVSGAEYDVVRKSWGFYGTPSLNDRLVRFGLRGALVRTPDGKPIVCLVERGHEEEFRRSLDRDRRVVLLWLDQESAIEAIERAIAARHA